MATLADYNPMVKRFVYWQVKSHSTSVVKFFLSSKLFLSKMATQKETLGPLFCRMWVCFSA